MARFNVKFEKQDYFNVDFKSNKQFNMNFGAIFEVPVEVTSDIYEGITSVTPKPYEKTILQTKDKKVLENITVEKIPYFETSNNTGTTIFIGRNE